MTGPPTVPNQDLNSGSLSFEANALLTEITRPDESIFYRSNFVISFGHEHHCHFGNLGYDTTNRNMIMILLLSYMVNIKDILYC